MMKSRFSKVGECLYRHRSSKVYYALIKRGGKQVRKSLRTTDREIATRQLRALRTKVSGRIVPRNNKVSFSEAAVSWLSPFNSYLKFHSFRRREGVIKNLKAHFRDTPITDITSEDCEKWATERAGEVSASSFNKEREALISVFAAAQKQNILLDNPATHLMRKKPDKKRSVIPTKKQFADLISTFRGNDHRYHEAGDLCELLAYSGMRLSEATSLQWDDIDFDKNLFTVTGGEQGTKNREHRTIPLFPALKALLSRLCKVRKSTEAPENTRVIPIRTAKKAMASACKKCGLPQFTHHSLRHYFCSNAIEAGVDFKTIASWLGHKDGGILVAKTYGHLRDTHSSEMAKRMVFEA